jgi:hypothetical protein
MDTPPLMSDPHVIAEEELHMYVDHDSENVSGMYREGTLFDDLCTLLFYRPDEPCEEVTLASTNWVLRRIR